jgi:hypothetical protein
VKADISDTYKESLKLLQLMLSLLSNFKFIKLSGNVPKKSINEQRSEKKKSFQKLFCGLKKMKGKKASKAWKKFHTFMNVQHSLV